tara:strand:- start:1498 stop:2175 length:678 start_codon:yes stop_codon:yes gene_type:complete
VNAFLGRSKIKLKWIYTRETIAFTDKDKDNQSKNMATKKLTQEDINAGRYYHCGNCDTMIGGGIITTRSKVVAGRPVCQETLYYCDSACANKCSRDRQITKFTRDTKRLSQNLEILTKCMGGIIRAGRTSKTCFEAIKMTRLELKCKTMLLGRETPRHIVEVELFKLSESAMTFAELVAEDEDAFFNDTMKGYDNGQFSQMTAYNSAMWAREHCNDKTCLSVWYD